LVRARSASLQRVGIERIGGVDGYGCAVAPVAYRRQEADDALAQPALENLTGLRFLPRQPDAGAENFSPPDALIERLDGASQEREGRLRGIQGLKPAGEGGSIRHAIGIFHRRRRGFPGTAFDKVPPQRLTAGDQMAVGKRIGWEKGNRQMARSAETAPNRDPVVVFVMSLLVSAAMTGTGEGLPLRSLPPNRHSACLALRKVG
jgi:hypothetical protein